VNFVRDNAGKVTRTGIIPDIEHEALCRVHHSSHGDIKNVVKSLRDDGYLPNTSKVVFWSRVLVDVYAKVFLALEDQ
jgi:hypothetical protein